MTQFPKTLILLGIILIILGIFWQIGGKFLAIGKLPGDIIIKKENFTFYFPLATSILLSIILTLIFSVFRFFR